MPVGSEHLANRSCVLFPVWEAATSLLSISFLARISQHSSGPQHYYSSTARETLRLTQSKKQGREIRSRHPADWGHHSKQNKNLKTSFERSMLSWLSNILPNTSPTRTRACSDTTAGKCIKFTEFLYMLIMVALIHWVRDKPVTYSVHPRVNKRHSRSYS